MGLEKLNIVGIILLLVVMAAGLIIKIIMKKRLNDIEGVGSIHTKEDKEEKLWI